MLTVERGGPTPPGRSGRAPRSRDERRVARGAAFDLVAVAAVGALVGLGVLNLYTVGGRPLATQQLTAVAVGLALLVVLLGLGVKLFAVFGWTCYCLAVLLLVAVHLVGVESYGARRWLAVGSLSFQPAELAKLGLLLALAHVLGTEWPAWRRFVVALGLALPPIGLTLVQPDLSTASLLIGLTVALLVLGRVPLRFLLPLFAGAAMTAPLLVGMLRPYQLARIQAFLSGPVTGEEPGWAVLQAHIALASGRLLGMAEDPRYPVLAGYLPGRQNDLALASLVEAFGLVAGAAAVLAALGLVWRLALASRAPRTRSGGLVAAGFAALFGGEIVVSVGGNLGLLPLAGVPFPLVGLGGTAAAVHLAALGVVLGARRDGTRRRLWAAPRWRPPRPRLVRAGALAVTALLVPFSAYGWSLHETQGPGLRAAGDEQMTRCIRIPAGRGRITDRHGAPLAVDAPERHVVVVPSLLRRRPDGLGRLAEITGAPVARLRRAVAGANRELSVRVTTVPAATGTRVDAAGLPGVFSVASARRVYPHGPLLGPLLGFVGVATPQDSRRWPGLPPGEMVGRTGVEAQYDPVLRGVDGKYCVYVDPPGRAVMTAKRADPVPGADLRLSLDLGLQRKLTAELAAGIRQSGGDLGGAVVMDPRTGQVLAMATLPSYDNNVYGPPLDVAALRRAQRARGHPTLEHVTQVVAPPGSVFKIVVAAADAVHPVVPPGRVVPTGGSFTYGGHTFGNWRAFGPQNFVQAIAWSNDVYFYKLALALGPHRIHEVGSALGVGRPTGIDLPAESSGYFGTPETVGRIGGTWYGGSTVILGIGQGYLTVTPLQAALWTSGIATGHRVTPRVGLAFGTTDGGQAALPAPKPKRLPFAGRLGPVREGMRQAATYGTAARLSLLPVQAGGKTGSAEDPASPNGRADSWYTAAAPIDAPVVVATSFVRGGGRGARTSGPVVVETLQYFFAHRARITDTPPLWRR